MNTSVETPSQEAASKILVCCGTGCVANGSLELAAALEQTLGDRRSDTQAGLEASVCAEAPDTYSNLIVKKTGCNEFCENGPIVRIMPQDVSYYHVKKEDAAEIVDALAKGGVVERLLYKDDTGKRVKTREENPFYAHQTKIALRHAGLVEPANLDDFLNAGGFAGLRKALAMRPDAVIAEVERSNLRGRGGAGFPTGRKWREAVNAASTNGGFTPITPTKGHALLKPTDASDVFVICNGDEGDPGAFMDRSIMEGDPFSVIEGLTIAAFAVGAHYGFMYIRDEYDLAVRNVNAALLAARKAGFLGRNILGSGFDFDIEVVRGGGAFVCGESTALMQSIEGKVGEPRTKYIHSVEHGLWDKPTVLNNVETLVNVPWIIEHGSAEFAKIGVPGSGGTKVFALVGKVRRTGLAEVPMGTTLRSLVFDVGGGVAGGRPFKAVQTGGPSGGCIPESLLDLPIDFDTLKKHGSMMGSGGVIVMDDRTCMVEVARYYTAFLSEESCGKCTPCREGLRRMLQILTDITEGRGKPGDIEELETIGAVMQDAALCALGRTAPNPVLSTIKYFRHEYEEHIGLTPSSLGGEGRGGGRKRCSGGVCKALTTFVIDKEKCTGCGACQRNCPADAITGGKKEAHEIDEKKCVRCGSCREACHFNAIEVVL
jgi:NADH-quinone oxidoreductase subunit F